MMYRVLAIIGGALALAACSSTPDWMNVDGLKPGPSLDTVSFESEPPGAEAKASNGQTCRTPCSLALPIDAASSVTFTLNGYLPETERLEAITTTGEPPRLSSRLAHRLWQKSRPPKNQPPRNPRDRNRPPRQRRRQRQQPLLRPPHRGRQARRRHGSNGSD